MLISLELLALLQSCTRIEGIDPGVPVETAEGINFAPQIASTKGLINSGDLARTGTKIRVYDYISNFEGTINGNNVQSGQTIQYFVDSISFKSGVASYWPYWNPSLETGLGHTGGPDESIVYPWTKTGTHTFFGFLVADQHPDYGNPFTYRKLFRQDPTLSNRVLSIPTTTMTTLLEKQFDFSYSAPVSIDAATRTVGTSVPLQLKHLFSAFRITARNTSGNTILLKSVTLRGMKNTRSATIDFKEATPTPVFANLDSAAVVLYNYQSSGENDYGRVLESLDQEVSDLMSSFLLMWPQTYAELVENPAINGARLEIKYKVRTVTNNEPNDSDELTAVIVLGNQGFFKTNQIGMDAGKKYTYTLQFKKSTMDIYVNVLPWEYEEYDWSYAEHSISARSGTFKDGVLAFYRYNSETDAYDKFPTTEEWSAKAIRFNTRNEVFKGRFFIEAPTAGRWQITPYPMSAAQYFIVEPTSGDINVNFENGMAEFTVSANPDLTPVSSQTLYFNVAIQLNGEWVDANSEFNRKNIKLVLDAN